MSRQSTEFLAFAAQSVSELARLHLSGERVSEAAGHILAGCPDLSCEDFFVLLEKLSADLPDNLWIPHPRFGNLSLAVASSDKYLFELLFWDSQVTAVHQHSFHGAFLCMKGRRLHCNWHFAPEVRNAADSDITYGELRCKLVELLKDGDIRTIEPGAASIHSLWSIDRPVLTALLREKSSGSGVSYLWPGISFNERLAEQHYLRRKPLLDILRVHDSRRYEQVLRFLGKNLSFGEAIFYSQMLGYDVLQSKLEMHSYDATKDRSTLEQAMRFDRCLQEAILLAEQALDPTDRAKLAYAVLREFMSEKLVVDLESACHLIVSNG